MTENEKMDQQGFRSIERKTKQHSFGIMGKKNKKTYAQKAFDMRAHSRK